MTAPFPWYGGKRHIADRIWQRLGHPTVYVEPFCGSLAVLLKRPGGAGPREVVCDTDGGICNFWRAVSADPSAVARHADHPSIHQDLTARHAYLTRWIAHHSQRLSEDPRYYDAEAAGWWVWGLSLWIGGGWCTGKRCREHNRPRVNNDAGGRGVSAQRTSLDKRPLVKATSGGVGTSAQRVDLIPDKRPYLPHKEGGRAVMAQRLDLLADQRPHVTHKPGGQGCSAQRQDIMPCIGSHRGGRGVSAQRSVRPALLAWFEALRDRLARVVVFNRSWESAVTPTVLMHTETSRKPPVGIFMDPPYLTAGRYANLYGSDFDGRTDDVAAASYRWAVEHGSQYRIAYCCAQGDMPIPDGWTTESQAFKGIRNTERRSRRECILYSPACLPPRQGSLF